MSVLEEISQRYSPPVIASKPVEESKVRAIFQAAHSAPSCFNNQPWRFVVVKKEGSGRATLEDALSLGNSWAKKAALLVAVTADPDSDCDRNQIPYYAYDLGLSVMCMVIEAEHQGLKSHQMAGYDENKVKKALNLPDDFRVVALIAVGYEGAPETLSDRFLAEGKGILTKSKERRPLKETLFWNAYTEDGA